MADPSSPTDLQTLKALGRAYLNANRLQEALEVFASLLKENPDEVETHLLLGDCYLASGDAGTAWQLYRRAKDLAPNQADIGPRLSLAKAEMASSPSDQAESIPTEPDAIARLLQRLTGRPVVTETEVLKAAGVLEEILNSSSPALAVAGRLNEIDALLPALLELNIRQARADGRPDLAEALTHLLENIQLQLKASNGQPALPAMATAAPESPKPSTSATVEAAPVARKPKVLFVGPPAGDAPLRQALPAEALRALGYDASVSADLPSGLEGQPEVVVIRRPQAESELIDDLAARAESGVRVILDLEVDFEQMSPKHPDYAQWGLNSSKKVKAYKAALRLADLVCVQSRVWAKALRAAGYPVMVMPPGWSRSNRLWHKAAPPRDTFNIAWIGAPGQADDVAEVRRPVMRLLREFPQTHLVVGGDPQVYELFRALPKGRKQFLPPVSFDEHPYLLSQADVLLVPLRLTPFNQSFSDLRLMEAGVRGIPWMASPLPAFETWGEGGLLARTSDEWYAGLRQLINDAKQRAGLGQAGRQQAEEREMSRLGPAWQEMIEKVRRGPRGSRTPRQAEDKP